MARSRPERDAAARTARERERALAVAADGEVGRDAKRDGVESDHLGGGQKAGER